MQLVSRDVHTSLSHAHVHSGGAHPVDSNLASPDERIPSLAAEVSSRDVSRDRLGHLAILWGSPCGSRLHRRIRPAGAAPAVPDCSAAKTFYDWNGDGCGDIRGTTERIEYLSDSGSPACGWCRSIRLPVQGRRLRHHRRGDPVGFAKRRTRWSMS